MWRQSVARVTCSLMEIKLEEGIAMESDVLARSIVVERRCADKAYELIDFFASRGYATVVDEVYYGKYAEFVIGDCDDGTFRDIISDIMVEDIELY